MTATEIKLAAAIARDYSIDLSDENFDILTGFGLPEFQTVTVSLRAVARCMRYQCSCLDGTWDYKQFNEDLPHYRAKVRILDLNVPELRYWLVRFVQTRLGLPETIAA